jgi:hypothetical protein
MKAATLTAPHVDDPKHPVLRAWEKFWFDPADPTILALMRIGIGCVALYTVITWGIGLMGFVGPDAWIDKNAVHFMTQWFPFYSPPTSWSSPEGSIEARGHFFASPYFHITDPGWIWTLHLAIIAVMILFIIGYQTRITSVLAWLGALSYMQRCQPMLFGMDTMTNLMLMYLCIAPCGAALSLDRWLEVRRLRRLGVKSIDPPAPRASARLALRLIQIHFCIIYLASGASKLQGATWWNATALWGCFANFSFAPVSAGWYQDLLRFLAGHRLLWEVIMTGGVIFTFVVELGLPFLVWVPRLRWLFIIGSILLHTGIGLLMGLTTFSMCMMCMVLAFAPPELIRPYLESLWPRRDPALSRSVPTPQPVKVPALAGAK